MGFKSRKLYVWLISLGAVVAVYLLYGWISQTPDIDIEAPVKLADAVSDSKNAQLDSETGKIGEVGVGKVQKARYTHLNSEKQIDREFGFEKLLHKVGNQWEIEKPYINIYKSNFKCFITSDKGNVQVETVLDRPSPKDATLTGNVLIHIVPEKGSSIQEGRIYLDDVIYISEKSEFSSDGPVKFVSEDALMLGRGLRLIYNDELERMEFLRIIHLDSLRIKSSASLFSSGKKESNANNPPSLQQSDAASPPEAVSNKQAKLQAKLQAKVITAGVIPKLKPSPMVVEQKQAVDEQDGGLRYRCVFNKNVIIDCPEQIVFADEVFINNIYEHEPKDSGRKSDKSRANSPNNPKETAEIRKENAALEHTKPDTVSENKPEQHNTTIAENGETKELSEEPAEIVITCEGGFYAMPMDSAWAHREYVSLTSDKAGGRFKGPENFDDVRGRPIFVAPRIDYCAATGDTVSSGLSELTFDINDTMGPKGREATVPVKITAQKKIKFLSALNQVIFEGGSLGKMVRTDAGIEQKYTLSAPELTVDLSRDGSSTDIQHLTASGEVVKLAIVKTAGEEFLGGIELKCTRFDYDPGEKLFLATGPGVMKIDNSKISKPKKKMKEPKRFSLQEQCYAFLRDFETLKYFSDEGLITADARHQSVLIDYIPIVKGKYGKATKASASHIEAFLYETADGRSELSMLKATGGITYVEGDLQFGGSGLFYDADKNMLTAWGDEFQPFYLNGALAEGIEYNLKTGRYKSKITGPGVLQMK